MTVLQEREGTSSPCHQGVSSRPSLQYGLTTGSECGRTGTKLPVRLSLAEVSQRSCGREGRKQ